MAAVLSSGPEAILSHGSAAALWGVGTEGTQIEVSVPTSSGKRPPGICLHHCRLLPEDSEHRDRIPLTSPIRTLLDLATRLDCAGLERSINEADKRGLTDPEALRDALDSYRGQPGVARLRVVLDRRTFRLTDSELERRFLPLAGNAGLPPPQTRQHLNGFRVDFFWPELGLVVETDGLRYHRTPAAGARSCS
jgi:hypothetical protein